MQQEDAPEYQVSRLNEKITIDADWGKPQWENIKSLTISKNMGDLPKFLPEVLAKVMYDDDNLYVIFQVKDRFLRSVVTEYNGPVSTDSCVEFFFAPDPELPLHYFNLEINAGGTPLMFYITKPMSEYVTVVESGLKSIEIAHSQPSVIDPEIAEPTTWTVECRLPLSLLGKYSKVSRPSQGVVWKANFYKTGSKTSNPNYLTWSFVDYPRPNFHLPEFFGTLTFQ